MSNAVPPLFETSPTFRLRVTQENIDASIACNFQYCAVARGIEESYRGKKGAPSWATYVAADTQNLRFTDSRLRRRFKFSTPPRVAAFIQAVDAVQHAIDRDAPTREIKRLQAKIKPFSIGLQYGQVFPSGWQSKSRRSDRGKKRAGVPPYRRVLGARVAI